MCFYEVVADDNLVAMLEEAGSTELAVNVHDGEYEFVRVKKSRAAGVELSEAREVEYVTVER